MKSDKKKYNIVTWNSDEPNINKLKRSGGDFHDKRQF